MFIKLRVHPGERRDKIMKKAADAYEVWTKAKPERGAAGLARGGSLENAMLVEKDAILCDGGLRFSDEPVRHKALDLLGDLALLGAPLPAAVRAERTGHRNNVNFAKLLKSGPR